MKRTHIQYLALAAIMLLTACYKDKGNYSYTGVNKIIIADTLTNITISVKQRDTLRLKPTISQTLEKSEEGLTFQWSSYDNSQNVLVAPEKILATTRNLDLVIADSMFILGNRYKLIFKATDKKTGISNYILYTITIDNEFVQGWIFMEDKNNTTDLAMLLPGDKLVFKVYTDRNSATPLGKPVKLEIAGMTVTDDLSTSGHRLYLLAENGGVELNYQTMVKKFDYKDLFFAPPSPVKPQYLNWALSSGTSASLGVAVNDGLVHFNLVGGFPGAKKWGETLLSTKGSLNYKAAPFVAGGTSYLAVLYDNTNRCFAYVASGAGLALTSLIPFPATASTPAIFDMNDVGLTMVNMDSSNVLREYNAVMKDDAGVGYLLRFKTTVTTAAPVVTLSKTVIADANMINASCFTGSTVSPHIFYGNANKLNRYETTSNTYTEAYSFGTGENITSMEFQRIPSAANSRLAVATWNGTAGKVYFFNVSAVGAVSPDKQFTGFAKVVDMGYKVL